MYRAVVADANKIDGLLNCTDGDWIDFIACNGVIMLICDSPEVFAILQYKAERSAADVDVAFRASKKALNLVKMDGILELTVTTDLVTLVFQDEQTRREVQFPYHQAFTATYNEKINILAKCKDELFDASCLQRQFAIARFLKSYVEVENGVSAVIARDGTRVFDKVPAVPNLCLSITAMASLFSCNAKWGRFQANVFAFNENFGVVVSSSRGFGVPAFELLEAGKVGSAAVVTFDATDVLRFASKLPGSDLVFDFKLLRCSFVAGELVYTIPLDVQQCRMSEKYDGVLRSSAKLFSGIIAKCGASEVTISVKKNFNKIECGGITVLGK